MIEASSSLMASSTCLASGYCLDCGPVDGCGIPDPCDVGRIAQQIRLLLPPGEMWSRLIGAQSEYYSPFCPVPAPGEGLTIPPVPDDFVPDASCQVNTKTSGSKIVGVVDSLSAEFARVMCQLCVAIAESDPCGADLTLEDKARAAGLLDCPSYDGCFVCVPPEMETEVQRYIWAVRLCLREKLAYGYVINKALLDEIADVFNATIEFIIPGDFNCTDLDQLYLANPSGNESFSKDVFVSTFDGENICDIRIGPEGTDCLVDCPPVEIRTILEPPCVSRDATFLIKICPKEPIVPQGEETCLNFYVPGRPEETIVSVPEDCEIPCGDVANWPMLAALQCVLKEVLPTPLRFCFLNCCPSDCEEV